MRLSNKLLGQRYVKERLRSSLGKFFGQYGDLIKQYEVPSPECYTTFLSIAMYSDTLLIDQAIHICMTLLLIWTLNITDFDFLFNCGRFPLNICNGCDIYNMPRENDYSSGHWVLSHFGTCMCSNVETNLSCHVLLSDFWVSNIPWYFCFPFYHICNTTFAKY